MTTKGGALAAAVGASAASATAATSRASGRKRTRSPASSSAAAASHSDCEDEAVEEGGTRAHAVARPASLRKKKVREGGHEGAGQKRTAAVSASSQLPAMTIMDLLDEISDDDTLSLMQLVLKHKDGDR